MWKQNQFIVERSYVLGLFPCKSQSCIHQDSKRNVREDSYEPENPKAIRYDNSWIPENLRYVL